jgi:hypothetical protein
MTMKHYHDYIHHSRRRDYKLHYPRRRDYKRAVTIIGLTLISAAISAAAITILYVTLS